MMNQQNIGAFIAQQRKEQNLTQQELANRLHLTDKAISKWETGRCYPDISLLYPLANELKISINELLNGKKMTTEDFVENKTSIHQLLKLSNHEKNKKAQHLNLLFILGFLFVLFTIFNLQFSIFSSMISNSHLAQGFSGVIFGLGIAFECFAFYFNNKK